MIVTRDADFDRGENDSFDAAQDVAGINQVLGYLGTEEEDWYAVAANLGDSLSINTSLPGGGPLEFVNPLSEGVPSLPQVELYDPAGAVVKTGIGAINYIAQSTGGYRVRLLSPAAGGEYLLSVEGATGGNTPPSVVSSDPVNGTTSNQFPTTYSLTFSEVLLEGTLSVGDLLINGQPAATAVTQTGPFTFRFDLDPAVNVGDGQYTISLPVGAVEDLQGPSNELFDATFTYDTTGPQVVDVRFNGEALPPGASLLSGPLTVDIFFSEDLSEELAAGQLGPEDVVLMNKLTNQAIAPSAVNYDATQNKATLAFPFVDEASMS